MTVELCQSTCISAGYTLAGVEYADECYCGNAVQNGGGPAPDGNAQCDMSCAGNSGETCGGPNRLDLYSYGASTTTTTSSAAGSTATSGWSYRGCYTDSVSARTLANALGVTGGPSVMTVELCQSTCHSAGYSLAGVEYSDECYCDNQLENGGGPAPDGNAQCNMKCDGSSTETCGGSNRLSLYSYGSANGTTIS